MMPEPGEIRRIVRSKPKAITEDASGRTVIQIACDRCSVGVMDMENPHRLGICRCDCHNSSES